MKKLIFVLIIVLLLSSCTTHPIRRKLELSLTDISECVKDWPNNSHAIVNFIINEKGKATKIKMTSMPKVPAEIEKCILGVIGEIEFDKPKKGGTIEVTQPLRIFLR